MLVYPYDITAPLPSTSGPPVMPLVTMHDVFSVKEPFWILFSRNHDTHIIHIIEQQVPHEAAVIVTSSWLKSAPIQRPIRSRKAKS